MNDPFHSKNINEIFRPIFAADRHKVLRRKFEKFYIVLYAADLKAAEISKDRIASLIKDLEPD